MYRVYLSGWRELGSAIQKEKLLFTTWEEVLG